MAKQCQFFLFLEKSKHFLFNVSFWENRRDRRPIPKRTKKGTEKQSYKEAKEEPNLMSLESWLTSMNTYFLWLSVEEAEIATPEYKLVFNICAERLSPSLYLNIWYSISCEFDGFCYCRRRSVWLYEKKSSLYLEHCLTTNFISLCCLHINNVNTKPLCFFQHVASLVFFTTLSNDLSLLAVLQIAK